MTAGKMLPLIEAMRALLRVRYPARPALADEVQTADWFRPPLDGSVRPVEEVQAVDEAFDALKDAILRQDVRICGRLNGSIAADIPPTEIDRRMISVLENTLEVYEKGPGCEFRRVRRYTNIHCYAAEIAALISRMAAAPLGVTKDMPTALSPDDAVIALIVAHKDSDRPKIEIENDARAIPGFLISNFPSLWKDYASPHQKRPGVRPRSVAAG
jgi:hypothetical protein